MEDRIMRTRGTTAGLYVEKLLESLAVGKWYLLLTTSPHGSSHPPRPPLYARLPPSFRVVQADSITCKGQGHNVIVSRQGKEGRGHRRSK